MADFLSVVIGIQARSTSERFPGKVLEMIGDRPMIKHVIDACEKSARYMNAHQLKTKRLINVVALIPAGDEVVASYLKRCSVRVFEGPEHDVLARYQQMSERYNPDYIVRITADCPEMESPLITKCITTALMNGYDYLSNVDESVRTAIDGLDVEVFSRAMLNYAHENAKEPKDREHVTTFMRREPPKWARRGFLAHMKDGSGVKMSVDTPEELEACRERKRQMDLKLNRAVETYGKENVHRF
jgi:spore coat polysaccharide biosynthesis protein SpsF (cytidylyltransferase family)